MFTTVKARKENAHTFGLCYEDICQLQNRISLPSVKAHLKKDILDFNGDRLTCEEWAPILNALSLDRSLHFIGIRSTRCGKTAIEDIDTESKVHTLERAPVIQTRFLLLLLMKALRLCMNKTINLTCMELEGLPLSRDYLIEFLGGVKSCPTLQNISLHRSPIGDEGCDLLCRAIKPLPNIVSIDLSNCGLTEKGMLSIADVIKTQKIRRYSESWTQTLRYQEPDLDSLKGLRRITLNHNPKIKDEGLQTLIDVTKDDIFLKALDMQDTGVTDLGGKAVLDMLKTNVSLAIVDLRANYGLSQDVLKNVMRQLHANNEGCAQEFHWIAVDKFQLSSLPRKGRLRNRSQSVKSDPTDQMVQCRTVKSEAFISPKATAPKRSRSSAPSKGIPWRVSERLDRRKEHANACPGTPRAVQFQEELPPYHTDPPPTSPRCIQLERAKQQIVWLCGQLKSEADKRQKLEEENAALKKCLEEFPGEDSVIVSRKVVAEMQKSLSEFKAVMKKLRDMGIDPEILQTQNTKRVEIGMHKSYSEHTPRHTSKSPKVNKVSKSACTVGNYASLPVESGVGDIVMKDTSGGTAGTLMYKECSTDSGSSSEDTDVNVRSQGDNMNAILYQAVMRKNKEMQYFTDDDLY